MVCCKPMVNFIADFYFSTNIPHSCIQIGIAAYIFQILWHYHWSLSLTPAFSTHAFSTVRPCHVSTPAFSVAPVRSLNDHFIANLTLSVPVKEMWKSISMYLMKLWQKLSGLFFEPLCIIQRSHYQYFITVGWLVYSTVCWWYTIDSTVSYKFATTVTSEQNRTEV